MPSTQGQSDSLSKWVLVAMGPIFFLQGITNLVSRHDIPVGIVGIVMGGAVMFSFLWKRPVASWVPIGIAVLMSVAGAVHIWFGRWVWGLFVLLVGILLLFVFREQQRQRL